MRIINGSKDDHNIEFLIGLTPTGILVYQNKIKVNSYFWPRIKKLDYKANKLMLSVFDKSVNIRSNSVRRNLK